MKCCIWGVALCGAETGTVWAVDGKQLEVLKCGVGEGWRNVVLERGGEMWCWRGVGKCDAGEG